MNTHTPINPIGSERRADCSLADLDYTLPEDLIAQTPADRREDARLLVVRRSTGRLDDRHITDLPDLLHPDDLLVLNNTKVLAAKLLVRRATGGMLTGLFVREESPGRWRVMLQGSRRLKVKETLVTVSDRSECAAGVSNDASDDITLTLAEAYGQGEWLVDVSSADHADDILARIGRMPLPPYIKRSPADPRNELDRARYQTVFASAPGAVAAPTAGLHLTEPLLGELRERGVAIAFATLHVGLGTFKPIAVERLEQHAMHSERFRLPIETVEAVRDCRRRGGRVIAIGTTSVRTLETAASLQAFDQQSSPVEGTANLFIYPPYPFIIVDVLLTNFHLPKSTLLALVSAFADVPTIRRAYEHAMEERYRFFSYGDAMLLI